MIVHRTTIESDNAEDFIDRLINKDVGTIVQITKDLTRSNINPHVVLTTYVAFIEDVEM